MIIWIFKIQIIILRIPKMDRALYEEYNIITKYVYKHININNRDVFKTPIKR